MIPYTEVECVMSETMLQKDCSKFPSTSDRNLHPILWLHTVRAVIYIEHELVAWSETMYRACLQHALPCSWERDLTQLSRRNMQPCSLHSRRAILAGGTPARASLFLCSAMWQWGSTALPGKLRYS